MRWVLLLSPLLLFPLRYSFKHDVQAHCMIAGTQILTPKGSKNIELIDKDDIIWTLNERTNRIDQSRVMGVQKNEKQQVYEVHFEGLKITVTDDHPFYHKGQFYSIKASNLYGVRTLALKTGQKILFIENNRWMEKPVKSIQKVKKKVDTFTITKLQANRIYFANNAASLVETIPSTFAFHSTTHKNY